MVNMPAVNMPGVIMEPYEMPKFRGKLISVQTFEKIFASYHWFEAEGRRLRRDEVLGIACICDGGGEPPKNNRWLWEKLEDPKQKTKNVLDGMTAQQKENLILQVESLFQKLLKDPVFRARHDDLQGFKGQFTPLPYNINRPVLDQQPLTDEQIYLTYAITNWCADSDGNKITPIDGSRIISRHYNWRIVNGGFPFLQKLANPNHALTKLVADVLIEVNHQTFFEGKARALHAEYAKEGIIKAPIPPRTTGDTSQSDRVPITTAQSAVMAAEAPAPSPKSHTLFDIDDYVVDYDSWQESQATEAPGGASGSNLLDKGKRRQRGSESESPEGGTARHEERSRREDVFVLDSEMRKMPPMREQRISQHGDQ